MGWSDETGCAQADGWSGPGGGGGSTAACLRLFHSTVGSSARLAAYRVLRAVQDGQALEQALSEAFRGLEEADRRLAHELAAGVLRQRSDLDARLQPLVHRGWSSVTPELRDVLRLGAYQLSALDRIPPHAAVSTTVELARSALGEKAARFANAILRGMGGRAAPPPSATDPAAHLADRYSHPEWLVRRWIARFGLEETEQLLAWNNRRPPLVLQPPGSRSPPSNEASGSMASARSEPRSMPDCCWIAPVPPTSPATRRVRSSCRTGLRPWCASSPPCPPEAQSTTPARRLVARR